MKITLAENINKYRKEKNMTQEELADILGVTFASVSKWERGVATPDLSLIMELANIFGISVDTLIGYEINTKSKEEINNRLLDYLKIKDYKNAIKEIDDGLIRFPNNFDFVYGGAQIYYYSGMETSNNDHIRKSISLYEKSISLINQNDNPTISEISIRGQIAECYIELKEIDKGIDILKKYNVCGTYNSNIAYAFVQKKNFSYKEMEPYLNGAIIDTISRFLMVGISYSDYFKNKKDYEKAIRGLSWMIGLLEELKENKNKISYFEKVIAYSKAKLAYLYHLQGDEENTTKYLKEAYIKAKAFDDNPSYSLNNTKLGIEEIDKSYAADSLGEKAILAVEKVLKEGKDLYKKWEEIIGENEK